MFERDYKFSNVDAEKIVSCEKKYPQPSHSEKQYPISEQIVKIVILFLTKTT